MVCGFLVFFLLDMDKENYKKKQMFNVLLAGENLHAK